MNDGPNVGFVGGSVIPWMRVNHDYSRVNVEDVGIYAYFRTCTKVREKRLIALSWTVSEVLREIPVSTGEDWKARTALQRQIRVGIRSTIRLWAYKGALMRCRKVENFKSHIRTSVERTQY